MSDRKPPVLAVGARPAVLTALALFGLWVAFSGKLDAFHLGLGLISAFAVSFATRRLYGLPPQPMPADQYRRIPIRWRHFLTYGIWLVVQIFRSGIEVAKVVLHPRLPIAPRVVRIADGLPHPVARLTLAHSITLTPGTVTIECDDGGMEVHALDAEAARSLEGDGGKMAARVRKLFGALER